MTLPWPAVLVPSSESWFLAGGSRSGGPSFSGNEQVVQSPSARWVASLTVPCNNRVKVLAMRALIAGLDGRSGTVAVGPTDLPQAPLDRTAANRRDRAQMYHATGAPAPMNAVDLSIRRIRGGALEPGQYFSLGERLYILTGVVSGDSPGPGPFAVKIRPWLRGAVPGDTVAEFRRPVCAMRLATDDTGRLEMQLARFGTVTLDLVEAF